MASADTAFSDAILASTNTTCGQAGLPLLADTQTDFPVARPLDWKRVQSQPEARSTHQYASVVRVSIRRWPEDEDRTE